MPETELSFTKLLYLISRLNPNLAVLEPQVVGGLELRQRETLQFGLRGQLLVLEKLDESRQERIELRAGRHLRQ